MKPDESLPDIEFADKQQVSKEENYTDISRKVQLKPRRGVAW